MQHGLLTLQMQSQSQVSAARAGRGGDGPVPCSSACTVAAGAVVGGMGAGLGAGLEGRRRQDLKTQDRASGAIRRRQRCLAGALKVSRSASGGGKQLNEQEAMHDHVD